MSAGGGVLLLHGHGRFGASMAWLAGAARREGYATSSPSYPYRRSLPEIVTWLKPKLTDFERDVPGPLHIITHSFGGLVARALLTCHRPQRLGHVVMLAPPNGGSELADLLYRCRVASLVLGASGAHLRTLRTAEDEATLGNIDYSVGVIAGTKSLTSLPGRFLPQPHDGKVSLAATHVNGIADHLILPVSHTLMVYDRRIIAAAMAFIENGFFTTQNDLS